MDNTFDEELYRSLIDDYAAFERAFSNLYDSLCSNNSTVLKNSGAGHIIGNYTIRAGKGMDGVIESMVPFKGNVTKLQLSLGNYLERWQELKASGRQELEEDTISPFPFRFGYSGDYRTNGVDSMYGKYRVCTWVDSGLSFKDYNDINAFMQSDQYWANNTLITGVGEYSNYKLLAVGTLATLLDDPGLMDYYTDEFLVSSIISVMDEMAANPMEGGISGGMKKATGLKAWDKIGGVLKDFLIKYYKGHEEFANDKAYTGGYKFFDDEFILPVAEMTKDPDVAAWIDVLAEESGLSSQEVAKFLQNGLKGMNIAGKTLESTLKMIETLDPFFKFLGNTFADYSAQIGYLDTIQESLLANGFSGESVHKAIDEVRNRYASAYYTLLTDEKKAIEKALVGYSVKLAKEGSKEVISEAAGTVLGNVDTGLKILSTAAQIGGANRISADKSLMGLKQWDSCLTQDLENYQEMIRKGIASESDLQEAERIFETLLTVKKKEYESMMAMCKEGTEPYNYYHEKYEELDAWINGEKVFAASDLLKGDIGELQEGV